MKRFLASRVFAAVLIFAGAGGLFTVFWLVPYLFQEFDERWQAEHSAQAHWEQTQKRIRLVGWWHDDFGPVGAYGDEKWAAWIMQRLEVEEDPSDCGSGHKVSALEKITNYAPAREGKPWRDVLPLWQAWWKENRGKTQEEWITSGFAAVGVTIHNPPRPGDWPALLTLVAPAYRKAEKGGDDSDSTPWCFYFNAFRCLRNSGFDPVKYALDEKLTPGIREGLEAYQRWETRTNQEVQPGSLFDYKETGRSYGVVHSFFRPAFRWGWGSASAAGLLAGLWLWRRRRRGMFSRR